MMNKTAQYFIEELALMAKTGRPQDCEDAIYNGPHFVAVIDGATAKADRRWDGETGGRVAARIISDFLGELAYDATAFEAFDGMTARIRQFYEAQGVLDSVTANPAQRIIAVAAIVSFFHEEIWSVGDCQYLLNEQHIAQHKTVDIVAAEARAMFLETELARGVTQEELKIFDSGRDFILPLLIRQLQFQNNPFVGVYSFAAVDGFPIPIDNVRVQTIPDDISSIVLATDGYPLLRSSLAESEAALRELLHDDPLLFRKYKSTKGLQHGNVSFDDRAYVKLARSQWTA